MNLGHDSIVERLFLRLREKPHDAIYQWLEYESWQKNGTALRGEFDVLRRRGNNLTYYEVKSHENKKAYGRALVQFERAQRAFPEYNWRFVLVTNEGVRRVNLERILDKERSRRVDDKAYYHPTIDDVATLR